MECVEYPEYPFEEFLSDLTACCLVAPERVKTDSHEFIEWLQGHLFRIYHDRSKVAYRGVRLIGVYANIRGLIDYYSSEGLARNIGEGKFVASNELAAALYEFTCCPEDIPGMPNRDIVAKRVKEIRAS